MPDTPQPAHAETIQLLRTALHVLRKQEVGVASLSTIDQIELSRGVNIVLRWWGENHYPDNHLLSDWIENS